MTTKNNMIKISYYLQINLPFDNAIFNITTNFIEKKIKSLSTLIARPFLDYVLWNKLVLQKWQKTQVFHVFLWLKHGSNEHFHCHYILSRRNKKMDVILFWKIVSAFTLLSLVLQPDRNILKTVSISY